MNVLKELNEGLNHLIQEEIEESDTTDSKENNTEESIPSPTKYQPVKYGEEEKWAISDIEAGTKEKPAYVKRKASGNIMLFPNEQSAKNYIRDYLEKEEE